MNSSQGIVPVLIAAGLILVAWIAYQPTTTAGVPATITERTAPQPRATRSEAYLDRASTAELRAEERKLDAMYGQELFQGGGIDHGRCFIRVDGDQYQYASDQDRSEMHRAFVLLCAGAYSRPGRHVPADGLPYTVYNLAGDEIWYDIIDKAGTP